MVIKHNVEETAIRQYIYDKFNENPLKIPFRMGTSIVDEKTKELLVYSLRFADDGLFDVEKQIDLETYMETKKSIVIMETALTGDFVAHPNIKSGSFSATVEILVNLDSAMSILIKDMINLVRHNFIGKIDVMQVWERDWNDPQAKEKSVNYTVVSNAGSIDYGNPFDINGRRYTIFSFTIHLDISKDIAYGNQVEFEIGVYNKDNVLDSINPKDSDMYDFYKTEPLIKSWGKINDLQPFQTLRSSTLSDKAKELHNYVKTRGFSVVFTYLVNLSDPLVKRFYLETFNINDKDPLFWVNMKTKVLSNNEIDEIKVNTESDYSYDLDEEYLENITFYIKDGNDWLLVVENGELKIGSIWRKFGNRYEYSRATFDIYFKYETNEIEIIGRGDYSGEFVEKELRLENKNYGKFVYDKDLEFSRVMVGEMFMPEDVIVGEPIILSVGLSPSAKKGENKNAS